jgi:hypothetical protein
VILLRKWLKEILETKFLYATVVHFDYPFL